MVTCSVLKCPNAAHARGWCHTHYNRWWKHGDVHTVKTPYDGGRPRTPDPAYMTIHGRLMRERGPAKLHTCQHCQDRPAIHWAYDHTDPTPRVDRVGCLYSTDLTRYLPLCAPCHDRFDRSQTPRGVGDTDAPREPWVQVPTQLFSSAST